MDAKATDRPSQSLRSWMGESAIGVAVALLAWWTLDLQTLEVFQRANRGESPVGTALWLIVIGGISTSLLQRSFAAFISATGVMLLGMVLGALVSGVNPVIETADSDFTFALARGAYNPAVPVITGAWIALTAMRWLERRRGEERTGP